MTPAAGVGDDACLTSGTLSYGGVLSDLKGDAAFTIIVRGYPDGLPSPGKTGSLTKARNV